MNLKNILIGVAIVILTIFVSVYGMNTIYPNKDYSYFCGDVKTQEVIETPAQCEAIGGEWNAFLDGPKPVDSEISGWCNRDYTCAKEYDSFREARSKTIFLITIPLGILIIALGAFVFGLEAVGAGLMGGGVCTLIYGAGLYWPYGKNWARFLISLFGLVAVIFIAHKFNKKK